MKPCTSQPCIAIFAKHKATANQAAWKAIVDLLVQHHYPILVCDSVLNARNRSKALQEANGYHFAPIETLIDEADIAVILGGDGTFLGVARALAHRGTPLIGINQGRLGFLTDIRQNDIDPVLIETLQGAHHIEARHILQGTLLQDGQAPIEQLAVNDVVISRGIVGGMVELRVSVDDRWMYDLRADGLIISTPTGSTAYALSAHGPIIHPSLQGILIVPVAPHALTNRPIALPIGSNLNIEVIGGKQTGVHFDMQTNHHAKIGTCIKIQVAPQPLTLWHPKNYDYFAMLRQKLHWSAQPTDVGQQTRGLRDTSTRFIE